MTNYPLSSVCFNLSIRKQNTASYWARDIRPLPGAIHHPTGTVLMRLLRHENRPQT